MDWMAAIFTVGLVALEQDAAECLAGLLKPVSIVLVGSWQTTTGLMRDGKSCWRVCPKRGSSQLLVIDDLADRPHQSICYWTRTFGDATLQRYESGSATVSAASWSSLCAVGPGIRPATPWCYHAPDHVGFWCSLAEWIRLI